MILFAVIMFATALLLVVLGVLIHGGRTNLIHSYHQSRVKDKAAYGRAMGKMLCGMAVPVAVAGILSLVTTSGWPVAVLIVGMVASFIQLLRVQRRYNGGLF